METYQSEEGTPQMWTIADEDLKEDENYGLLEENRETLEEAIGEDRLKVVVYPSDRLLEDDIESIIQKGVEIKSYEQLGEIREEL